MTEVPPTKIINDLLQRFEGTVAVNAWGETSLFYNPDAALPRGVYFATIKEKDGENDSASELDRDGVFRLNVGTSKSRYFEMFGPPSPRPSKGRVIDGGWNFTQLDKLTPHPVYGWMNWVSVLNPSTQTLEEIDSLIVAAHEKAVLAFNKRLK